MNRKSKLKNTPVKNIDDNGSCDSRDSGSKTSEQTSGSEGLSDEHLKILNAIRGELPDIVKACVLEEVASLKEDLHEMQNLTTRLTSQYHEAIDSITNIEKELSSLKKENDSLRTSISEIHSYDNTIEVMQDKEPTNKKLFPTDDDITNLVEKIDIHDEDESGEFSYDIDNPIASSSKTSTPKASSSKETARGQNLKEIRNENEKERLGKKPTRNKLRLLNKYKLPSDCNLSDSQNTLRYPSVLPGLVELTDNSRVYLKKTELEECLRSSKNGRDLARNLMTKIFTCKALKNCSMVGEDAVAYDRNKSDTRPGLDENARETIVTFVENYQRDEDWQIITSKSIRDAMKNFLHKSRK